MNRLIILLVVFSCFPFCVQDRQNEKIRIGTYDSRAIAIAYAASKYNAVSEKMKQYEQAKADGDAQKAKELEAWGAKHQRALHRQGFGAMPVHDLLAHVKDQIPGVAKAQGVTAIVRQCDFVSNNVEIVDVTQPLVKLFQPSEKTLKTIASIKNKPFVDLDDIEELHKNKQDKK